MRRSLRFFLGESPRELTDVDPTMTVLEYLRRHEARTGTKEGCAEGDCGACTVVLAEPASGRGRSLRYRPVNACIQFMPALDGRQLLTVEDLKAKDGALHPVQEQLCAHHASQCGFCTPGFVMSMYAAWKEGLVLDRAGWRERLAGNLCRCTGYGPILAAATALGAVPAPTEAAASGGRGKARRAPRSPAQDVARTLAAYADDRETLALQRGDTLAYVPRTLDALAGLIHNHPDALLVAGLTDVGLWKTKQHRRLTTLIFVNRIDELRQVTAEEGRLVIGAAATLAEAASPLAQLHRDFDELLRRFASVQIREVATVGGNIANGSPIGDLAPAFIALGAEIVLRHGARQRTLPLEAFFIDYGRQDLREGEFVEALLVPRIAETDHFACYKLSKRFQQDISAVCGAFAVSLDGNTIARARVCFGGMAATPKRAQACERALAGQPWTGATMARAGAALARDFAPITDMRASAEYRMLAARNLLVKFYLETSGKADVSRLGVDPARRRAAAATGARRG